MIPSAAMGFDLLLALPLGLLGGWGIWTAFGPDSPDPAPAVRALALCPILVLVAAAGHGYAFDGYRSDLWVYLTVVERVADGDWLLGREPYLLAEPGGPHHSLNWLVLGVLTRASGADPRLLVLGLRWLSLALLSAAAYRLARCAFAEAAPRGLALFCFWAATPQLWAEIGLNRSFATSYLLFASASAFDFAGRGRQVAALALAVALAFWTHFFGGLLALGGVALATASRLRRGEALRPARLAAAVLLGLALAGPWIALYLARSGAEISESYLWGPGQVRAFGLRWLHPARLLRELSPPVLLLAALGLAGPGAAKLSPAVRTACRLGAAGLALVLLTPLYHLWSERLGGWLALRLLTLGFFWLPAAAALAWLFEPGGARRRARAGALLALAAFWLGAARVVRDFRQADLYGAFSPSARAEARSLRALLYRRGYVSLPTLAFALAPHTLGHPLAVPPGRASPFHDFDERDRRVRATLRADRADCWAALLADYPEVEFLVTPALGARAERRLWRDDAPETPPESTRETLASVATLEPVHRGAHYAVDRIRLDPAAAAVPLPSGCPE